MQSYFDFSSDVYSKGRPTYPPELYLWLSNQVKNQQCVWDCACGTGQVSIDLAAYFEQVEATDISESQIAEAIPHRKVNYKVSPSEVCEYPDQHFDAICVGQALHWFDLEKFWPEVKRTLKPGGIFACWGYSWLSVCPEIDDIINSQIMSKLKPHWPAQNRTLWNQYDDVTFPLEMLDVPEFELTFKWNAYRLFDYMQTWSAIRALEHEDATQVLADAWDAIIKVWQEPLEKREVTIPFFVKAGRVL